MASKLQLVWGRGRRDYSRKRRRRRRNGQPRVHSWVINFVSRSLSKAIAVVVEEEGALEKLLCLFVVHTEMD